MESLLTIENTQSQTKPTESKLKICALSDLHGDLPIIEEPCELVCICGDISPLNIQANDKKMREWLLNEFKSWCEALPCNKIFFIAGNHDFIAYRNQGFMYANFSSESKAEYLCDDYVEYTSRDGSIYKIYGTPWCKQFYNWPFMASNTELTDLYLHIPNDLDILLTHDQPYGYGDIILQETYWNTGEHIGNKPLLDAVFVAQPKYMFCGHLHSTTHDCVEINETKRYNVSIKDEYYNPVYAPLYLEI